MPEESLDLRDELLARQLTSALLRQLVFGKLEEEEHWCSDEDFPVFHDFEVFFR